MITRHKRNTQAGRTFASTLVASAAFLSLLGLSAFTHLRAQESGDTPVAGAAAECETCETSDIVVQMSNGAWIGVSVRAATNNERAALGISDAQGLFVEEVEAESPASLAGIKRGDILLSCDGVALTSADDLGKHIQGRKVGERVSMKLSREGVAGALTIDFATGKRPSSMNVFDVLEGNELSGPSVMRFFGNDEKLKELEANVDTLKTEVTMLRDAISADTGGDLDALKQRALDLADKSLELGHAEKELEAAQRSPFSITRSADGIMRGVQPLFERFNSRTQGTMYRWENGSLKRYEMRDGEWKEVEGDAGQPGALPEGIWPRALEGMPNRADLEARMKELREQVESQLKALDLPALEERMQGMREQVDKLLEEQLGSKLEERLKSLEERLLEKLEERLQQRDVDSGADKAPEGE